MATATAWIDEIKSVDGLTRLLSERGAQLAVMVLLVILGLDCALILTRMLGQDSAVPAPGSGAAALAPAPANINPTVQLAMIVNGHLFGVAGVSNSNSADAPQTTMPLVLAGVIAQKDPKAGQAIIGESASNGKLYSVGGAIPGGARLNSVYGDRVLIERNGAIESLPLPRTPMAGLSAAIGPPVRAAGRDNSSLLAGLVNLQPKFDPVSNKLTGYLIFPGNGARGASVFSQLGLRAGDLVVAVNGTALDDPSKALEVMQTLSSASSATLSVTRGGQLQEVNLNLASVNVDTDPSNNAVGAQGAETPPAVGQPPPRRRFGGMGQSMPQTAPAAPAESNPSGDSNAASTDH